VNPREGLEYVVGAYFHEDWDIEGTTSRAVLHRFASSETLDIVRAARDGAAELLAEPLTEAELEAQLNAFGTGYYPPGVGSSYNDWLAEVVAVLTACLNDSPS
jgi:hypothetical protein